MSDARRNLVGGEWTAASSGETSAVTDPAEPDTTVAEYQWSTAGDAEAAVEAAAAAQPEWAATPGPERGDVLYAAADRLAERRDDVARSLTREEGKPIGEARGEVDRSIEILRYYAGKARDWGGTVKPAVSRRATLSTRTEPLGVAALITPWNYPIAIPAWKLAPALATGNAVVLKPAEIAPGPAFDLVECLAEAGVPDGVVNVVNGDGAEVGATIVGHEDVDAVSFTGSTAVGTAVYQQATEDGKRAQSEMGGKNPLVVTDSADVDEAVEIVAAGAFGGTGQSCTATSRAIVHEAVHDQFVDALVEHAEGLTIGPGLDEHDIGPHVSESEQEGSLEYVDVAKNEGATLRTGGGRPDADRLADGANPDGHYVEPTVFTDVTSDMRIAQEEVFGPVLAVLSAADFDEAVDLANDVPFGLSAGVVTGDHAEAKEFVDRIDAGVVKINEKTTGLAPHVPFGGMKNSSARTYREQGDAGLAFFTETKTVYDNY